MSFKKFDGSTWQSITPKQLKGIPYTGTLPATLTGTKAGYLHRYKIYGNTEQTGTPTPENPIVPSECGERTENLWDGELEQGSFIGTTGEELDSTTRIRSDYIHIQNSDNYTITLTGAEGVVVYIYDANKRFLFAESDTGWRTCPFTRQIEANRYVRFGFAKTSSGTHETIVPSDVSNAMLTAGSTAPSSYIPYGYKLPLTSAGQDVDIYLGESQTTRKIAKIDLGTLNWSKTSSGNFISDTVITDMKVILNYQRDNALSDMFTEDISSSVASTPYSFSSCLNNQPRPYVNGTGFEGMTAEEFKEAMSGVYMYYVLATEKTGTLNEPLRKIGDYADTIDSTQTTAQIPTTVGETTISWAGEGLAPSEFDSIQEWEDITTYTRVNGEWVADN